MAGSGILIYFSPEPANSAFDVLAGSVTPEVFFQSGYQSTFAFHTDNRLSEIKQHTILTTKTYDYEKIFTLDHAGYRSGM